MYSILVIEDDFQINKNICYLLETEGMTPFAVHNYDECISKFDIIRPDLVLMDILLPDGNGFELCKVVRKMSSVPVIMITSCDSENDIVKGLTIGADDYVTKPFRKAELVSRIKANLRRTSNIHNTKVFECGNLKIDVSAGRIYKNNDEITLRKLETDLLMIFIQAPGRLLSRDSILSLIWDNKGEFVDNNTLSVNISRLRNKIGREYIETVHGIGYRLVVPVREV